MRILGIMVVIGLAILGAAWVIGDGTSEGAIKRTGEEEWPQGLGTLASVEARLPRQEPNAAARQLIAVAAPLDIRFALGGSSPDPLKNTIGQYVAAEHVKDVPTIGAPPPEVVAYLQSRESQIDALRDHLLQSETIAWDLDIAKGYEAPMPNLLAHMHIARLLTARALVRAREHDSRAWEDLHAAWNLTRSLEARPETISQLIALAMTRMINAAAWKLPPRSVPWLRELQQVDHRHLLLGALQYDTWMTWRHGEDLMKSRWDVIVKPYLRWSIVEVIRRQRKIAEQLAAVRTCGFDSGTFSRRRLAAIPRWNVFGRTATPNLDTIWQRAFRSVAEREATANAMRIARGEAIAQSQCSDGTWKYEKGRLSFSRELPASSPAEKLMPLSLWTAAAKLPLS